MYLNVNNRELATILAALRDWQRKGILGPTKPHCLAEYDIASDEGNVEPLDANEIDALCESINGDDELPGQLVAALERASAACEAHNAGGKLDYDWIGEAENVLSAAYAVGLGPQVSVSLKRLLMAEIDNEADGGDSPTTLETVLESLEGGCSPYDGFPVEDVKAELAALIDKFGKAPADRFVCEADWKARAEASLA